MPSAADVVAVQPIVPDKSMDCIGLFWPILIANTREAMRPMAAGQIWEMLSDYPGSDPDMKSWVR